MLNLENGTDDRWREQTYGYQGGKGVWDELGDWD